MFGTVQGDTATVPATRLSDMVDHLHALDWTALGDELVLSVLRELETQHRRLPTVDQALVAEVESRGLAGPKACRNTAALLGQLPRSASAKLAPGCGAPLTPAPALVDREGSCRRSTRGCRRPRPTAPFRRCMPGSSPTPSTGCRPRVQGRNYDQSLEGSWSARPGCSSPGCLPRSPDGSGEHPGPGTAPAAMRKTVSGAGTCGFRRRGDALGPRGG